LGSPLQFDERTFWRGENCGHSVEYFYWPKIQQDVNNYLRSYTSYAISKTTINKKGLYTPLPTHEYSLESISMDDMSGLPSTKQGNDCIFVVIDWFLNMAILIAYKKNITLENNTKCLFE
jgi:hypothetical protein